MQRGKSCLSHLQESFREIANFVCRLATKKSSQRNLHIDRTAPRQMSVVCSYTIQATNIPLETLGSHMAQRILHWDVKINESVAMLAPLVFTASVLDTRSKRW